MRLWPLPLALLLAFATSSHAGALNLRWDRCRGDGGVMNKNFACNTNTGFHVLVGSFVSPIARQVIGLDIVLDIALAGGSLPPWWQFMDPGSCRPSALGISVSPPEASLNCPDWASDDVASITGYQVDFLGPATARVLMATGGAEFTGSIVAGQEYFAFRLIILNSLTAGAGSCAGCSLGACLALKSIRIRPSDLLLEPGPGAADSDDRLVTWQGGSGVISHSNLGHFNCPLATPVRQGTWASVKAMYR